MDALRANPHLYQWDLKMKDIRGKITAIAGWEEAQSEDLANRLSLPLRTIRIALAQLKSSSPDTAKGKCTLRLEALRQRLEAIPNWTQLAPKDLAGRLGISMPTLSGRIFQNPHLREAWARGKQVRHERARQERAFRFDFRSIRNWRTMTTADLLSAMGVDSGKFYASLRHSPVLRKAWATRLPYTHLGKRKCEFDEVPGWQTLRRQDIAKAMGISRSAFSYLLKNNKAMSRRFYRGHLGFSQWPPEKVAKVHALCSCEEEALRMLKVGRNTYRDRLARLGIPPLPARRTLGKPTFPERLEKIPGWLEMNYTELGAQLGYSCSHVRSLMHRHPELLAQHRSCLRLSLKSYSSRADKIMGLADWVTTPHATIAARTGIPVNTIMVLMQCVPRLFQQRPPRHAKPWTTFAEDIQSVPGWQRKSFREIGLALHRSALHVKCAIMESPDLRQQWQPKLTGGRSAHLRTAILALPNWKEKTAKEISFLLGGKDVSSVKRCLCSIWTREHRARHPGPQESSTPAQFRAALARIPNWTRCNTAYVARELGMKPEEFNRWIARDPELAFRRTDGRKVFRQRLLRRLHRLANWRTSSASSLARILRVSAEQVREAIDSDPATKAQWNSPHQRRPWHRGLQSAELMGQAA